MSKTTKIVIGVAVVVVVIAAGYMFLSGQSNTIPPNAYQNSSQQGSPSFSDHIQRAMHEGGILPGGDGGGG
jgi:flagellar basal body-associated protein FliL